jgi:hypothetical protein
LNLQINEYKEAGTYTVDFDGTELTSGIYLYKTESGTSAETKKMLLVK